MKISQIAQRGNAAPLARVVFQQPAKPGTLMKMDIRMLNENPKIKTRRGETAIAHGVFQQPANPFGPTVFYKIAGILVFAVAGWLPYNATFFSDVVNITSILFIFSVGVILVLWREIKSPLVGFLAISAWYVGVGSEASDMWMSFFNNHWGGIVLVCMAMLHAAPVLFISRQYLRYGLAIVCALTSLSPFCVCSPLVAAISFFPGSGAGGLVLVLATLALPAIRRIRWFYITLATLIPCSLYANMTYKEPALLGYFVSLSTADGSYYSLDDDSQRHKKKKLKELVMTALQMNQAGVIVTPESVEIWDDTAEAFWAEVSAIARQRQHQVLLGVSKRHWDETQDESASENGLLDLGSGQFYGQTLPMPFGMWKPWEVSENHYPIKLANLAKRIPLQMGGTAVYLICYEELIPWILAAKMLGREHPVLLITAANQWFSKGQAGWLPQQRSVTLQARMWDIPLRRSVNTARNE